MVIFYIAGYGGMQTSGYESPNRYPMTYGNQGAMQCTACDSAHRNYVAEN